ncbi:DUF6318 family protein, partial [Arthrobacter sp. GMC3]|uniref:DUF6318 family protein n=1 Tax=Arthrobacter sp. GMC3 TaxID=2058894 RepID=UPI0021583DBA
ITALLLITGCTSLQAENPPPLTTKPAPTTTATTSTATPPTPAPAPAPVYTPATADGPAQNVPTPILPEKAKEFSKEGLEAFARHWYTTLGYAYETGDVEPLSAITDPSCKTCSGAKTSIARIYDDGGWIVGAKITVDSSTSNFASVPD